MITGLAVGCTGGQHRSVYIAERLGERLRARVANVLVRHRELHRQEQDSTGKLPG